MLTILRVGGNWDSYIANGVAKWDVHFEKHWKFFTKLSALIIKNLWNIVYYYV